MSYPNETRLANLEAILGTDTAAQLAWLSGVTAGTAAASKALVLNSSGGISTITSATITTLNSTTGNITTVAATTVGATTVNVGASGTAGTLNIYPTTAANGILKLLAVNNTGPYNSTISNSNIGQATVYSLPDPGAATCNFVVDQGNQTIAGTKTFSGTVAAGTVTGINVPIVTQCTTELDKTSNTTPAALVGLSQTVVIGKYDFECDLYGTAGASGGWNVSMVLTTAVISAINTSGFAFVSGAAPTITNNTTGTSTTALLAATAAVTNGRITGTITFSTGGTFALYFCQNASNGTASSIYVGSKMRLTRTA